MIRAALPTLEGGASAPLSFSVCTKCGTPKEENEFPFSGGKGKRSYWCGSCHRSNNSFHKDKDPDKWRLYKNEQAKALRAEVIAAYGSKCCCCGETEYVFLTLDHVNGGGNKERQKHGGWKAYRDAKRRSFPPDYRVFCFNCNWATHALGVCPHQATK